MPANAPAPAPVVIEIDAAICEQWDVKNPIHANVLIMDRLRKAGIPVVGDLGLRSVAAGTLTTFTDFKNGKKVYRFEWQRPSEDEEL